MPEAPCVQLPKGQNYGKIRLRIGIEGRIIMPLCKVKILIHSQSVTVDYENE